MRIIHENEILKSMTSIAVVYVVDLFIVYEQNQIKEKGII